MKISEYEVFKFGDNTYSKFKNKGKDYLLNKEPYLDIVLTDHCNANCDFCIADLIHDKLIGDFEIFKQKILFAIDKMNIKEVLLLGGEPTMSKMLLPMIKWLNTLNLDKIIITTNGIRLARDKRYREEIISAGLTNINVSFMNIDAKKQAAVTHSRYTLQTKDIEVIYKTAQKYGVSMRVNNNVFVNNNDTLSAILKFYDEVSPFCDSIKISPLLEVDDFSVINKKTLWAKTNRLNDKQCLYLFEAIEKCYSDYYNVSIIENDLQFGFVKNTMIPLKKPIILNWNFGDFTGMMKKVTEENKINNIKLLANNELSLSWNREATEYYIETYT